VPIVSSPHTVSSGTETSDIVVSGGTLTVISSGTIVNTVISSASACRSNCFRPRQSHVGALDATVVHSCAARYPAARNDFHTTAMDRGAACKAVLIAGMSQRSNS
jgi:hypothetical protein